MCFMFPAGTTKEHLGYAMALRVPVFVVVTKIDLCRSLMVEKALRQLELILKGPGCKKIPIRIKTEDDAITAASNFDSEAYVISGFFILMCMLWSADTM